MFCNKCGTENPDEAMFCSSCGNNMKQNKSGRLKLEKVPEDNVTDSVTSASVPATIEDGVVMYFDSFTEEQKELINKAIVKKMPDIFIRQMFTMGYNDMKEFFDSYYNE